MKNIDDLLEKYFEGLTSLDEEKDLRDYFQQNEVPPHLEGYRPLFSYFTQEIEQEKAAVIPVLEKKNKRAVFLRWTSFSVAAGLALFIGIKFFIPQNESILNNSLVYIDGVKYTDLKTIQLQTLHSLEKISESNDDVISSQIEMLDAFTE